MPNPFAGPIDEAKPALPGFYRIMQGRNTIRVLTHPITYSIHWVDHEGSWQRRFCEENCPHCVSAKTNREKAVLRYAFWILHRKQHEPDVLKVLEVGKMLFNGIGATMKATKIPFQEYDIEIYKDGAGLNTRYEVAPCERHILKLDSYSDEMLRFPIKAIVGDQKLRYEMFDDLAEEERVLNRNW